MKHTTKLFTLLSLFFAAALFTIYVSTAQPNTTIATKSDSIISNPQINTPKNQITMLYDAFGRDSSMKKDWGFSALVEVGGKRILFDTGNNSEIFAHNIKAKGVNLAQLDFVVMSHRHGDHMGGLNYLLSINPNVTIYAPKENFGVFGSSFPGTFYRRNESLPAEMRYFGGNPPVTLRFGTPWSEGQFTLISETTEIAPGFHLIMLKGSWGVDLDVMEISLAIETPLGIVLIVGCSHPTIEKIVEVVSTTIDKPIHLVVGGLHLLPAKDEETQRIANVLHDNAKVGWIAPVHCTGEYAFEILKKTFGVRYLYGGLGTTITLGPVPASVFNGQSVSAFLNKDDFHSYRELARSSQDMTDYKAANAPAIASQNIEPVRICNRSVN